MEILASAKDNIEASAATVAAVRAAHGGDARSVARGGEPVMDGGADSAPLDRRLAPALMAGNQQQDAVSGGDGLLERSVDRFPGAVEIVAVKVERAIGLDVAGAKTLVPTAIQGRCPQRADR